MDNFPRRENAQKNHEDVIVYCEKDMLYKDKIVLHKQHDYTAIIEVVNPHPGKFYNGYILISFKNIDYKYYREFPIGVNIYELLHKVYGLQIIKK